MLAIKLNCENCNTPLPPNSENAMICSFECTWCKNCNDDIFENVCPNCGGGLEKRPIRPKQKLEKYPASLKEVYKPADIAEFNILKSKLKDVLPKDR